MAGLLRMDANQDKFPMIKVLIVDDHIIFREGLKRVISGAPDMEVAGEAGDGLKALDAIADNNFDVVLLDLSLPGMEGLDVLRRLQKSAPKLPVLILSIYSEEQYALRVLKNGASGYLTKESVPSDLIRAIRKAFRGERYISDSLAEILANQYTGNKDQLPHERLSNREYEIFRMIASGKPVKQISHELSIARTTVTSYRTRILDKMTMKSNVELIRYALENDLIQ